jgi:hypothetical protein
MWRKASDGDLLACGRHTSFKTSQKYREDYEAQLDLIKETQGETSILMQVTPEWKTPFVSYGNLNENQNPGNKTYVSLVELAAGRIEEVAVRAAVPVSELTYAQASSVLLAPLPEGVSLVSIREKYRSQMCDRDKILLDSFCEEWTGVAMSACMHQSAQNMQGALRDSVVGHGAALTSAFGSVLPPAQSAPTGQSVGHPNSSAASSSSLEELVADERRRQAAAEEQEQAAVEEQEQEQERAKKRERARQDAALFDMPERVGMHMKSPGVKFEILCRAASDQRPVKERSQAFTLFRNKNAVPFLRCFETCFESEKERFMKAWEHEGFAYSDWRKKCVVSKGRNVSCLLLELEVEKRQAGDVEVEV